MLAIIGGEPRASRPTSTSTTARSTQFGQRPPAGRRPLARLRRRHRRSRRCEEAWPHYAAMHDRIGARARLAADDPRAVRAHAGPDGALFVGSPETVARKIAKTVRGPRPVPLRHEVQHRHAAARAADDAASSSTAARSCRSCARPWPSDAPADGRCPTAGSILRTGRTAGAPEEGSLMAPDDNGSPAVAEVVVIGSGSAGAVVARRLVDAGVSVVVARGRRAGCQSRDPRAGAALRAVGQRAGLGLSHRAAVRLRGPRAALAAGQGAGRVECPQRDDLRAGSSQRLRHLGVSRQRRLEL